MVKEAGGFHPQSPKARDRGHPDCGLEKITGTGATRRIADLQR